MARIVGKVHFAACLLVLLAISPTEADPFFVRVYGRTYKIDPRYPADEPKGPKPQEAMKALPSDLRRGPGVKPSHEEVLAEVEERVWIARNQLDSKIEETAGSVTGADTKAVKQEITGSLASGNAPARSPELQELYDRHRALNLLARELRRSLDLPVRPSESGFSRPKLTPEIEASYSDLNFDVRTAYDGYRRVKAAFRSGDPELLARVTHYPLSITGSFRRIIRNRNQLMASKNTVMNPHIREVVAKSTFESLFVRDKGMMVGDGMVWITPTKTGFGLGAVSAE